MPRKPLTQPLTLQQETPAAAFSELCAEFVRFKKLRNLAPDTISYYEDCARYFNDFFSADTMCEKITKDTYYDYIEYLHETKPNLSPVTERSYLTGIRAILYYGMKKGYIKEFRVELPKVDEVVKDTYTDQEIALLLKKPDMKSATFAEYRNWVIINYMLGTGNRAGTIVEVKIEDLDFDSNTIILKKLKGRKQYVIPVSRSLAAILREYLSYRNHSLWPGIRLECACFFYVPRVAEPPTNARVHMFACRALAFLAAPAEDGTMKKTNAHPKKIYPGRNVYVLPMPDSREPRTVSLGF